MQNDIGKLELFEKVPEPGSGVRAAAAAARPRRAQTPPNCRRESSNDALLVYGQTVAHQVACWSRCADQGGRRGALGLELVLQDPDI